MQNQSKILISTAIIIIVLVGGYWMFASRSAVETRVLPNKIATSTESKPRSDVIVKQSETTAVGNSLKLPAGFPTSIPVELATITESYSAFYQKHNSTQYTVTYTSSASIATKWDEYNAYMIKEGYSIVKYATIKSKGTILGTKGADNLTVVITKENNKTTVHVNVLKQG